MNAKKLKAISCSMVLLTALLVVSCKKEDAASTKQKDIENAMLEAGFTPVAEKDIPKDVTPLQLSEEQINNFLNGNKKDRISSSKSIRYASIRIKNSKLSVTESLDEEPPIELEPGQYYGSKQYYYFNNCNVRASVTFQKNTSNQWVHKTHGVNISNAEDNGSSNYFSEAPGYSATNTGTSVLYSCPGKIYCRITTQTYSKNISVSGNNSKANITANLVLTISDQ
ncbi:hypothetical protein [Pedobacter africanus]|uniref:Lipoprotein n=1 Tax=Pedobacter africanus TaxID=151894 RepID=A0A1W2B0F8_9SPHI|nr:hypothetical protein [Pedobacter africanus]SMC66280.1 hypothetical protein SAMN04488524_1809 [Pedobacter africanus]